LIEITTIRYKGDKMVLKVIDTTDGKYVGEVVSRDISNPFKAGEVIEYKGTVFAIDKVEINNNIVKLVCSNYIVELEIISL